MPTDPFVGVGDLPSLGPLRYLDVRDQTAFDAGHAPGAVRVPLEEWDAAAKAADTGFAKTAYWDDQTDRPCPRHRPEAAAVGGGSPVAEARTGHPPFRDDGLQAVILQNEPDPRGVGHAATVDALGTLWTRPHGDRRSLRAREHQVQSHADRTGGQWCRD